jgi:muramidase (phage lysozyme)
MPRISPQAAGGTNVCAALDAIATSEIGTELLGLSDDGYNVLVGSLPTRVIKGVKYPPRVITFSSYATHPDVYNTDCNSTAAGRYQTLFRFYAPYKAQLHLPDFGPVSQDLIALQLIRECHALDDFVAGRFAIGIVKCNSRWASLPGAGYNQHENTIEFMQAAYAAAGGVSA